MTEAKLRSLSRAATGVELTTVDGALGIGIGEDSAGRRGIFLAIDDPRAIGRALHWASTNGLATVDILAERSSGDLARRAGLLTEPVDGPSVQVWQVTGADATPAVPVPPSEPPAIPADHWALAGVITEAGARALDDHGMLVGDLAGLEVCRIVEGADGPTIDVGVGQADRELHQLVHGKAELDDELRRVISAVAQYRRRGSHHPLTRVGRERWLRSVLLDQPGLVGAERLEPVVPLRGRQGLKIAAPAAAAGTDPDGRPLVVVTMSGVDLDLVPEAADYRDRHDPDADLVLVVPPRDLALNSVILDRIPRVAAVALPPPWEAV